MTVRRADYLLLVAFISCGLLTACPSKTDRDEDHHHLLASSHKIVFSVAADGSNNCLQSLDGASPVHDFVQVPWGDKITFSAAGGASYTMSFPPGANAACDSPFQGNSCQASFASNAANSGTTGGMKYPYNSIVI